MFDNITTTAIPQGTAAVNPASAVVAKLVEDGVPTPADKARALPVAADVTLKKDGDDPAKVMDRTVRRLKGYLQSAGNDNGVTIMSTFTPDAKNAAKGTLTFWAVPKISRQRKSTENGAAETAPAK